MHSKYKFIVWRTVKKKNRIVATFANYDRNRNAVTKTEVQNQHKISTHHHHYVIENVSTNHCHAHFTATNHFYKSNHFSN